MITPWKNLPIRFKVISVIMVTNALVLCLAAAIFIGNHILTYHQSAVEKTATMARVIGSSTKTSLLFDDQEAASRILKETLTSLDQEPTAILFDEKGDVFASFPHRILGGNGQISHQWQRFGKIARNVTRGRHQIENFSLHYFQPVVFEDERLGTLVLHVSLHELFSQIIQFALVAAAILVLALSIGILWSTRLQEIFARPLLDLAATMTCPEVRDQTEPSLPTGSRDELAQLKQGFQRMQKQIALRDQELDHYNTGLKKMVQEKTRDLSTSNLEMEQIIGKLQLASRAAEAENHAKAIFLARMNHEIRTPMIGLLGMTELLKQSRLDETQAKYVEMILSSGRMLLKIIDDLVIFSQIEKGRLELDPVPFDLRKTVEEILDLLATQAQDKGLTLQLEFAQETPPVVFGDGSRLRQIILNLVSNAVKFTPRGKVEVLVEPVDMDEGRGGIRIRVRDTGIGMDDEVRKKIFRPFTQADPSTARHFGGTGLGLAIVKELVSLMDGDILIHSAPGRGTTFSVRVPLSAYRE